MARTKVKPTCAGCGSNDALYFTMKNGDRLPTYTYDIATGKIYCGECDKARKS